MSTIYSTIATSLPSSAEVNIATPEVQVGVQAEPTNLYAEIVPEKPSILAEERIFVYIPKVAPGSLGIAKFMNSQFNVVDGEVSLKPDFVAELQQAAAEPSFIVSADEPTTDTTQILFRVI